MFDRSSNSRAKWFAVSGSLIAGFAGIIMAVLSLAAGEETGAGALLAASGLAFGLLATNLDRAERQSASKEPATGTPAPADDTPEEVSLTQPVPGPRYGGGRLPPVSLARQRQPRDKPQAGEAATYGRGANHRAGAGGALAGCRGVLEQEDQRVTRDLRADGEEPRRPFDEQVGRIRPDTRGSDGGPERLARYLGKPIPAYQRAIESRKRRLRSSSLAGRGESLVTRCCGSVPAARRPASSSP